eukprot:m.218381 g.218381  ORF g.218381 m.218381 type:complete len:176 (-) comp19150_c1_seq2:271-798(-)
MLPTYNTIHSNLCHLVCHHKMENTHGKLSFSVTLKLGFFSAVYASTTLHAALLGHVLDTLTPCPMAVPSPTDHRRSMDVMTATFREKAREKEQELIRLECKLLEEHDTMKRNLVALQRALKEQQEKLHKAQYGKSTHNRSAKNFAPITVDSANLDDTVPPPPPPTAPSGVSRLFK